jgi:hypothetical protein
MVRFTDLDKSWWQVSWRANSTERIESRRPGFFNNGERREGESVSKAMGRKGGDMRGHLEVSSWSVGRT